MVVLITLGILFGVAFGASAILFAKERTWLSFMQLLGAGCFVAVVLTHVAEALQLFPGMGWGLPNSAGHYVDLIGAIGGLTLFPAACLARGLKSRSSK